MLLSLRSPGCPGTHSADQAGSELRDQPASASQVLGSKACATTARLSGLLLTPIGQPTEPFFFLLTHGCSHSPSCCLLFLMVLLQPQALETQTSPMSLLPRYWNLYFPIRVNMGTGSPNVFSGDSLVSGTTRFWEPALSFTIDNKRPNLNPPAHLVWKYPPTRGGT